LTDATPNTTRSPARHPAKGEKLDLLKILVAILLPPVGVFLEVKFGFHFWLNILLTILGYIPGIIHAVWVILRY